MSATPPRLTTADVAALTDHDLDARLAEALRAINELHQRLAEARRRFDALHDEKDRRAIQRRAAR
jgi:hypothetical protein